MFGLFLDEHRQSASQVGALLDTRQFELLGKVELLGDVGVIVGKKHAQRVVEQHDELPLLLSLLTDEHQWLQEGPDGGEDDQRARKVEPLASLSPPQARHFTTENVQAETEQGYTNQQTKPEWNLARMRKFPCDVGKRHHENQSLTRAASNVMSNSTAIRRSEVSSDVSPASVSASLSSLT